MNAGFPKILFCGPGGRPSPSDWSGIPFHLSRALEALTAVEYLDVPGRYSRPYPRVHPSFLWRRVLGKWTPLRDRALVKGLGQRIARAAPDPGVVCFATNSTPFAFLPPPFRAAYFHDAVMDQYYRLYGMDRHLSAWDMARERRLEQRALERAEAIFYSSEWAAAECRRRLPPDQRGKACVVGMGANLALPSRPLAPRPALPRLLWVGSDWPRKGGDLVLDLFSRVRAAHPRAELTLVGAVPEEVPLPEGCRRVPFLNKTRGEDYRRAAEIYESHDFLVHPTRADCSACVASEAQLYGCLPLTSRVGGVPELVAQGRTGHSFELGEYVARAEEAIRELCADAAAFARMREAAREHALACLTWDRIALKILGRLAVAPGGRPGHT
jgi:glycosyltransferase involved in cell wall biosynthesis